MSIQRTIRIRKERESQMPLGAPRTYCRAGDCMYRIWKRDRYVECPRHPGLNPEVSEAKAASSDNEGTVSPRVGSVGESSPAARSLPPSRLHEPYCKCRRCDVEI